ncbi:hypothetical protein GCM10010199_61990 [Dactylosporangium roseum]
MCWVVESQDEPGESAEASTSQPFGREPEPAPGLELPLFPPGRLPPPPPVLLLLPEPGRELAMGHRLQGLKGSSEKEWRGG